MTTAITRLITLFHGRPVGTDAFGNRYYEERRAPKQGRRRRWVVYNGETEASRVPPEWHGWLHYTQTDPPKERAQHSWQKVHLPNLTGTPAAYRPPGHTLEAGRRERATGDYEPWTPS